MKICFIIDKKISPNSYAFIFPILINKHNLNFKIEVLYKHPSNNYDLIFVDSKYFSEKFSKNDFNSISKDLLSFKNKCKKLVYCDNEASIFINNSLFNLVDIYLKGRLPKNLNTYKKKLYGQREDTDFYNKKYNIVDQNVNYSHIIDNLNYRKIILGWNNGICDYSYFSSFKKVIFNITNKVFFNYKEYNSNKKKILSARFKQSYNRNTINYHRKIFENLCDNVCETRRVSRFKYFRELNDSIFSLSPFGWGEICYRDFESFLYSCVLIKPDMEHLITWPNYYIKDVSYLSLPWISKENRILEDIISKREKYEEIARFGYNNYIKYLDNKNELLFKNKFEEIINKIL
jgi:hypothetical protein